MSKKEKVNPFYYQKEADKGNPDAMCMYAEILYKGKGLPINKKESARYFRGAANQGNVKAMVNYANIIGKGDGVPVNKKESAKYFKMAADKGEVNSMFYYAQIVYRGEGVPIDKGEAAKYYKMAAHAGKKDAMHNYAMMIYKGDGIPSKKPKAARYFKMAADKGQVQSMYEYATMLSEGNEIPVDKNEAARYFKMAADKGHVDAKNKYIELQNSGYGITNKNVPKAVTNPNVLTPTKEPKDTTTNKPTVEPPPSQEKNQNLQKSPQTPKSNDIIRPQSNRSPRPKRKPSSSRRNRAKAANQQFSKSLSKVTDDQSKNVESQPKSAEKLPRIIENQHTDNDNQNKTNENQNKPEEKLPPIGVSLHNAGNQSNVTESLSRSQEKLPKITEKQSLSPSIEPISLECPPDSSEKQFSSSHSRPKPPENQPTSPRRQTKPPENQTPVNQPKPPENQSTSPRKQVKSAENASSSAQNQSNSEEKVQQAQNDQPQEPEEQTEPQIHIPFDHDRSNRFRGIIHHLTEKCGGNVHNEGVVDVTSSSVFQTPSFLPFLRSDDDYDPYNIVDLDNEKSCFESDDLPNSWVCYDFQTMRVKPEAYSIRTYMNGHYHVQNWVIEGSNDKKDWTTLDEKQNENSINGVGKSNTFDIQSNDQTYRYLRLRQTAPTSGGMSILNVSALEFFGTLIGNIPTNTQKRPKKSSGSKQLQPFHGRRRSSSDSNESSNSESSFESKPIEDIPEEPYEIRYDNTESGRFSGIIQYLSDKCNGNVHKKGAVEVTSSSVLPTLPFLLFGNHDDYNPYNCVDLKDKKSCFESGDEEDSWICYDFQNLKVRPNSYSIRSYMNGDNHLQSWCIEGSNDKENWTILDERRNETSLDGTGRTNTFTTNRNEYDEEFYRYLRLRQTGPSTINSFVISISALEYFGSIVCSDKSFQPKRKRATEEHNALVPSQRPSSSAPRRSSSSSSERDESNMKVLETLEEPLELSYDDTETGRFRGVIHHLSEKIGGKNVHIEGVVNVTSSSIFPHLPPLPFLGFMDSDRPEDYDPYNCVDLDNKKSCFESSNEPNSWICYDFQELKVKPKSYSIRTYMNGYNHLQNWCIEASNDNDNWTIIDERRNERSLDDAGRSNTFVLNRNQNENEFYKYLRLRQTGPTTGGGSILNISALEFFGTVTGKIVQGPRRPPKRRNRQNRKSSGNKQFVSKVLLDVPDEPHEIAYDDTEEGRFKGVIHYLSDKCGGNVHKKGAVEVTSSSVIPQSRPMIFLPFLMPHDEDYNPYNCVDLDDKKSCFESANEPNSWICYDFQNLRMRPNMYSIRSYMNGDNHLLSWVIEGSNDYENWTILDERKNERSLDETGKSNTFTMNHIQENEESYRYLRLRQTGRSTINSHVISISALEFFGSIFCSDHSFVPTPRTDRPALRYERSSSSNSESDSYVNSSSSESNSSSDSEPENVELKTIETLENPVDIPYDHSESGQFNGVIHYLTEKCGGGNVHIEGFVNVTSSSVIPQSRARPFLFLPFLDNDHEDYNPYNCVDLEDMKSCFESANEPDSWICYDFRELKVRPNSYSIRSYMNGDNHLQSWVIEGSNDKKEWTVLDERKDDRSLNQTGKTNSFTMNNIKDNNETYRYLRLRQTGPSTIDSHVISISALEFFGTIEGQITQGPKRKRKGQQKERKRIPSPIEDPFKDEPPYPRRHNEEPETEPFVSKPLEGFSDQPLDIKYNQTDEGRFKGIIHYLGDKCGGNVHKGGAVEVSSSSVIPSLSYLLFDDHVDYNPYNCVDLEDEKNCFESGDQPNSWVCYDFQNLKVRPDTYSIRTYKNGDNHIQSWCIEGSNNKTDWVILDERRDEKSLDGSGKSSTFTMKKSDDSKDEFYRYLRLRQTGRTTEGMNILNLSALEYFGSILC